jgi:hypothetical protein
MPDTEVKMTVKNRNIILGLLLLDLVLLVWIVAEIFARRISPYIGVVVILVFLMALRHNLTLYINSRPLPPPERVPLTLPNLILQPGCSCIPELLQDPAVLAILRADVQRIGQVSGQETWRLGLLTPDQARYDVTIFGRPSNALRDRMLNEPLTRINALGLLPVTRTAVLQPTSFFNLHYDNLLISHGAMVSAAGRAADRSYKLAQAVPEDAYASLREIQINYNGGSHPAPLADFLRDNGFPIKAAYADGDPLTTERGGVIVGSQGKVNVFYPHYFVQCRLIDDEGNLVFLGLDEDLLPGANFNVHFQPAAGTGLLKCVSENGCTPILRYHTLPYASADHLPVLDTPISANGWADLYIGTSGQAKLFIAGEFSDDAWKMMLNRLRGLLYHELAHFDYNLLPLLKDASALEHYLSEKTAILDEYYTVQDWQLAC